MKYPRIVIDLSKIETNTRFAAETCAKRGVSLIGVTKACLGAPEVARAMLSGGATGLGDSRIENLARLREAGIKASLTMLRLPSLSEIDDVVELADISLNSDAGVIQRLGQKAAAAGFKHGVILMVDTGDRREGVNLPDIDTLADAAAGADGVELMGVGTNVACLTDCAPTPDNLNVLAEAYRRASRAAGRDLAVVSGGNSSAWDLLAAGILPAPVNELRFGEAILLGRETGRGRFIEGMSRNAFVLEAEIIESGGAKDGRHIAALGKQDIDPADLTPVDADWSIIKASSDHLVLRNIKESVSAGTVVSFIPGYASLMRSMTSQYVAKQYV